jgi:hypothetical protein
MFILCRAAKNEPRKRAKGCPFGTPATRRSTTIGGAFAVSKFFYLRGIVHTPQMGLHWQDFLRFFSYEQIKIDGASGKGPPLLAVVPMEWRSSFPYRVRRICSGYNPTFSLKVLEGVWGDFFQEVPLRVLFT